MGNLVGFIAWIMVALFCSFAAIALVCLTLVTLKITKDFLEEKNND